MLSKITPELQQLMVAMREKWLAVGLKTSPTFDLDEAWDGICQAYEAAGREKPILRVWMESPLRGAIACSILAQVLDQVSEQVSAQVNAQVSEQVRAQVLDQVREQVREQVSDQVSEQVSAQVNAQVSEQVRAQVRAQVLDQVREQVSDQVSAQVSDQVSEQVSDQVRDFVPSWWYELGQFDGWWLAFYNTLSQYCDFGKLNGLCRVARACSFAWVFPQVVVFSAHPVCLYRDSSNRLHCENGPAIGFSDGWGVWAWHGVRVNSYVIEKPTEITVAEIEGERNAEVRRVLIERYGQGRYLLDSGAKKLQSDDFGTLYRKEIVGDEPLVMVKVVNATPEPDGSLKDYFIRVPPDVKTARQAVAWTFGKEEAHYAPLVQT